MTSTKSQRSGSSRFTTPEVRLQQQVSCDVCLWLLTTRLSSASLLTCTLLLLLRQTFLGKYRKFPGSQMLLFSFTGQRFHDYGSLAFKVKDQRLEFAFGWKVWTPSDSRPQAYINLDRAFLPRFENSRFLFLVESCAAKTHIFYKSINNNLQSLMLECLIRTSGIGDKAPLKTINIFCQKRPQSHPFSILIQ